MFIRPLQLAGYCVMMLMFVTGHRSVADPFENIIHFDEASATFIIADKMNGDKDDGRMVWLCDTAIKQLKMYVAHLKALSTRISAYDFRLSNSINESSEGKGPLPLFFLLKIDPKSPQRPIPIKLTSSSLSELLELPVPLNWSRHYLSSHLRINNVPVEYIDQQLDHVKKGQRFDGQYSILSVDDIGSAIQPILEKITLEVGWSAVSGIQSFPTTKSSIEWPQHYWVIGSKSRANQRIKNQIKFKNRVKIILQSFSNDELHKEGLTKLSVAIKSEFHTEAEQIKAQILVQRFLKQKFVNAEQVLRKYWSCPVQPINECSVFNLSHGNRLFHARRCIKEIHSWARKLSDGEFSKEEWLALFISSAIFEGGVAQERFINQLLSKDITQVTQLNNILWFNFIDNSYEPKAIRRWLPDTLTSLVFIKLNELLTYQDKLPNFSRVKKIINKKFNVHSIKTLLPLAKSLYHQTLPAYLAHYITGKNQSASLPENAWLRLMTGKQFTNNDLDIEVDPEIDISSKKQTTPLQNFHNYSHSEAFEKGELLRKEFRLLLNNAYKGEMTKKQLIDQLTQAYTNLNGSSSPLPPFLDAFMKWTISVATDGRIKVDLAISTVRDYFLKLGKYISYTTASYADFNELDDDDYSDIYIRILDSTTKNNRATLADLLESFHHYLQKEYNVPVVNFNVIEPNRKKTSVRPNLLLPHEFQLARMSQSRINRSILTLSFRAGMRGKEIRKLPVSGINAIPSSPSVMLGNKTKTRASIRQIPLMHNISDDELADLESISELCSANNLGKISELFPINATRDIHHNIRVITGDASLVNYDLRHSAVTISTIKHTLQPKDWPPFLCEEELDEDLPENNNKSRRTLFQIAMQAGHSSPSTTLISYMHLLDWSTCRELVNKQHIDYALLNKLSGVNPATLRKVRERSCESEFDNYILEKALVTSSIPIPADLSVMIEHEVTDAYKSQSLQSIYIVLECLQLFSDGTPLAIIAEKTEIDIDIIQQWILNAESVALDSGYHVKIQGNNQKWLVKKTPHHLKQLAQHICSKVSDDTISRLCTLFIHRYQHNYDAVFFDSELELKEWVDALCLFGIARKNITVLVPTNHSFSDSHIERNVFLASNELTHYQLLSHGVNSRSWSATKRPGLGISVNGVSDVDKRSPLQAELNLLIYATCLLINESQ